MNPAASNRQKYESQNPLKRHLLARFHQALVDALTGLPLERALDVGCAEGMQLSLLRAQFPAMTAVGLDIDPELLTQARRCNPGVDLHQGSVLALPFEDRSFDTVICCEVLEHVPETEQALRELCRVARHHLVLSVPHEPWFQLGNLVVGSHLRSWGNPGDHVHHWTRRGFAAAVSDAVEVDAVRSPFPWTILSGRPKSTGGADG